MNLIVLTNESFPNGMAGTNRILSYSKGIVEQGSKVKVICLKPTEKISDNLRNEHVKGSVNGVDYEYSSGTTIWPESGKDKVNKIWYILKGHVNAIKLIKQQKRINQSNAVALLLYSNSTFSILFFYLVTRVYKINYLQEKSEYPFILRKNNLKKKIFSKLYVNIIFKMFDGAIIETEKLIEYYRPKFRRNSKILRVPMTVDPERFSNVQNESEVKKITYCGNMGSLDNVDILINAFKIILKKHKDVTLLIIGDILFNPEYNTLMKQVRNLKIENKVLFTGRLNREEVPIYLCNSTVLALASSLSQRSSGSLPSKLGEYLCTGNPVVTTSVGEIPIYLKDNESAYLAEPGSVESFAFKLDAALSDVELSKKIGQKGKEVALKNFDYKIQSKMIINFINEF